MPGALNVAVVLASTNFFASPPFSRLIVSVAILTLPGPRYFFHSTWMSPRRSRRRRAGAAGFAGATLTTRPPMNAGSGSFAGFAPAGRAGAAAGGAAPSDSNTIVAG